MAAGHRLLRSGPGTLSVWLVILLVGCTNARYFGGYYQDQAVDPAGILPPGVAYEEELTDPAAGPEADDLGSQLSSLDAFAETPLLVDPNEASASKMFYMSNHAQEDPEWNKATLKSLAALGQVAGVAASQDFLYLFHRGNTTWTDTSFNLETNVYNHQNEPIPVDTVVAVDLVSGEVMFSWGKQTFFMPHGISVDPQGNIWLTDVALHQAFRYKKNNFVSADLVLGEKFVPGTDDKHFCKPTDVAISSSGVVFIADGYCNSRVMVFSAAGKYLAEMGHNDKMLIPHSLTLLEVDDLLCVADRENGRILCYNAGLQPERQAGRLTFEVGHAELRKLYAIAHLGDVILALNGGSDSSVGVSIDLATEQVVDMWAPTNETFHEAHDLTTHHSRRCFYVAQFGPAKSSGGPVHKVVKFDLIESRPKFMN